MKPASVVGLELDRLSRYILWTAFFALSAGMLFAVLLLLVRLPWFPGFFRSSQLFSWILVLHVNYSIIAWYCAFLSLFVLRILVVSENAVLGGRLALISIISGQALIVAALFDEGATPVMNNYLPVLESPFFFTGVALLIAAPVVALVPGLLKLWENGLRPGLQTVQLLMLCAFFVLIVAVATTLLAFFHIPSDAKGHYFYELLFWGGGHLLQAVFTLIMCAALLWVAQRSAPGPLKTAEAALIRLSSLTVALSAIVTLVASTYAVDSSSYRAIYTYYMSFASWLPVPFVANYAIRAIKGKTGPDTLAIKMSVILFVTGLILGGMIRGDSLLVPAHYHAVTAAINFSFFAVIFQFRDTAQATRQLSIKLIAYFAGVTLLVTGLAASGFMDLPRKTVDLHYTNSTLGFSAALLIVVGGLCALAAIFSILGELFLILRNRERQQDAHFLSDVNR